LVYLGSGLTRPRNPSSEGGQRHVRLRASLSEAPVNHH